MMYVALFIFLFLLALFLNSAWGKGKLGEFAVKRQLNKLPETQFTCWHDLTIQLDDGSTQIDHVVIGERGIFVIETKNLSGWIFGSEHQKMWTQKIHKNHSQKFQNPLHQNYRHQKALEALLDIPIEHIHSVIVFTHRATLKTDMPSNVMYSSQVTNHLRQFQASRTLTLQQLTHCVECLNQPTLKANFAQRREHKRHVERIKQQKTTAPNTSSATTDSVKPHTETPPRCKKCGTPMVIRQAKNPEKPNFWGCANFPKCRARPIPINDEAASTAVESE